MISWTVSAVLAPAARPLAFSKPAPAKITVIIPRRNVMTIRRIIAVQAAPTAPSVKNFTNLLDINGNVIVDNAVYTKKLIYT